MVQLSINNKRKEAKALLEYLKNLSFVKIIDTDFSSVKTDDKIYNQEFVEGINKILKNDNFKEIDPLKL
ncbi:MAG: hypothetical protein HYU67_06580 [Flavobacteriia bacterium]|nr:hypothetical protein [Flavobacteriia bacterium]